MTTNQHTPTYNLIARGVSSIAGTLELVGNDLVATSASDGSRQVIHSILCDHIDTIWAYGERLFTISKYGAIGIYWLQADANSVITAKFEAVCASDAYGGVQEVIGDIDAIALIDGNGTVHLAAEQAAGQWTVGRMGRIDLDTTTVSLKDQAVLISRR